MPNKKTTMKNNVVEHDIAYIIAPACVDSRGHFVEVLRRATGEQGMDGAACCFTEVDNAHAVWVVRGHQVPWGDGRVNVFSISDSCLRPIRGNLQEEHQQVVNKDANSLLVA